MHQVRIGETVIPTIQETISTLTAHTAKFGVPLDYDRMLEYEAYYIIRGTSLKKRIAQYVRPDKSYKDFKPDDFIRFLKAAGVSTGLLLTDKGEISLGADSLQSAINTGLYSEELVKIMSMYLDMGKCFKAVSVFKGVYEKFPVASLETWDNHRMIMTKPIWAPQNTGRIGAQEPGIMNFGHEIHDIFTVPKGFIYYEIDSGQIEPRIIQSAYLRDPQLKKCTMLYNDAYYGYVHFCKFLTAAERRSGTLDIQPIEITDEMKELRKKFKTFGNATMYGSTENILNDPDKDAFIKCIGQHPKRLEWVAQIERQLERGQILFPTAFGTMIDITHNVKTDEKTAQQIFHDKVKRAINNPIQGTGADLMRYSVKRADELLKEKAPNSVILQYVHDAGKFAIHESDHDKVIDELKEITAYQVDDWIPIYSGCEGLTPGELKRFVA